MNKLLFLALTATLIFADESTEILGKGRKIKPAEESLRWIGSS